MIRVRCDADGVAAAARAVSEGRIVAYPTDTVYALGCDPYNAAAVSAVYAAKRRDRSKPMPVLCATASEAWRLAAADPEDRARTERFWPGALTVIAGLADGRLAAPMALAGGRIGVRVPASAQTRSILEACGPLVGTSANVSGSMPTRDPGSLDLARVDLLIDGGTIGGEGRASTVAELRGGGIPRILREGSISAGDLERVWTS